jgi:subtilisin family serine protease
MMRRYAIIEVDKQLRSGGTSPSTSGRASTGKVNIHEADLSKREVGELARDPSIEDYGLIMPTRLIKPVRNQRLDAKAKMPIAWGISAVGADRTQLDGSGVTVAVLDTGIDREHPAFATVDIEEEDFAGSGNGDKDGHGTHCAGTIFGKDVGDVRIGIARNISKALIAKVFPDSGNGDSLAIFRAMEWAANKGANIVSMSLGFDFPGMVTGLKDDGYPIELATSIGLEHFKDNLRMFDSMMRVIEAGRAFGRGPLVIAASGNESQRDKDPRFRISASLPSAATGVVSVAAVRSAGGSFEITDFSNGRAKICAPGEDILSASAKGEFAVMSGTSMACPHVAGIAALWWQKVATSRVRPNAETVAQHLLTAATTTPLPHFDPEDSEAGLVMAPT